MVPDRLSYSEMYYEEFKYPSEWTESFDSYTQHRKELCAKIVQYIENYNKLLPKLNRQTHDLTEQFFSAEILLERII
jgi:hypothetical protein